MSRFRAEDDTEFIELNEWEQELTFFHTLIKVTLEFEVHTLNPRLEVGWYGMVCHNSTSLPGSKPYRQFFSEKHHTGMSQEQYRSQ